MADTELERLLKEGIAAARAGDRARACDLLLQVVDRDEEVEAAWLWLSGVVDDPQERQICLENVLALNPDNDAARRGLRWLREQGLVEEQAPPAPAPPPPPPATLPPGDGPRRVLSPIPEEAPLVEPPPAEMPLPPSPPEPMPPPRPAAVELDPFGCPYCGGSVSGEEMRCDNCRRLVTVRYRKSTGGPWLGWLVFFFGLLGAVAAMEGYLVAQLVGMGGLPEWFNQTAVRFMVGSALLSPEGIPGKLVEFAGTVTLVNYLLAGLCLLAALGLALRNRIAYFGSLFLAGLLVMITGAGLLVGLTGWLPALFRLGLIAISVKWLIDSAPAFEWQTRLYDADVDNDLRTDLDYYNRGLRYRDMGMWAKAAAHWKVAAQLGPSKGQYRVALANAYVKLGHPRAALAEAERALARTPEDEELRAFRDSLAGLEGAP